MAGCLTTKKGLFFLLPVFLMIEVLLLSIQNDLVLASVQSQGAQAVLRLLDHSGRQIDTLVDGNQVQFELELNQPASQGMDIRFVLDTAEVAACSIAAGGESCTTGPLLSLGWFWDAQATAQPQRMLTAVSNGAVSGGSELASLSIQVKARPVVMVHGFASSWEAWANYLGPEGYLVKAGLPGFAVGDGQAEGRLNTGSLDDPAERTNTIQQNAEVVGRYIAEVKKNTGAEMVDLLAHSMGGLISRAYIGQTMQKRDVAQLIMLGSPMAGTECTNLPAALGLYLPASLEIRPSYVEGIFNQQVTRRRGLAFYGLAGDPITEAFKSPCTSVPTDIAVSQNSVMAIPLEAQVMPVLHMDLNTSETVFSAYVLPLLQKTAGEFPEQPDPVQAMSIGQPLQFTRVFTGHLDPGESREIVIQIENGITVAGFSMYDTSRSLENRVVGASGKEIELTPEMHGLVVVKDPSALFYLGYGFNNPRPGQWRVTLLTTKETPPTGADYALTAYMIGGARLEASVSPVLPQVDEPVTIEVLLTLNGQPVDIQGAQARLRTPEGEVQELELAVQGDRAIGVYYSTQGGLFSLDVLVSGSLPEGAVIERSGFLTFQVQPETPPTRIVLALLAAVGLCLVLVSVLLIRFLLLRRRRR